MDLCWRRQIGGGESYRGHFRLLLWTVFYLDFKDTFVVSLFRRNLVSVSCLDKWCYLCSFGNNEFRLSL